MFCVVLLGVVIALVCFIMVPNHEQSNSQEARKPRFRSMDELNLKTTNESPNNKSNLVIRDWSNSSEKTKTAPKYCQTDACRRYSQLLTDSMDLTVDPCEDFYQYVCGNWHKSNPLKRNERINMGMLDRKSVV